MMAWVWSEKGPGLMELMGGADRGSPAAPARSGETETQQAGNRGHIQTVQRASCSRVVPADTGNSISNRPDVPGCYFA